MPWLKNVKEQSVTGVKPVCHSLASGHENVTFICVFVSFSLVYPHVYQMTLCFLYRKSGNQEQK